MEISTIRSKLESLNYEVERLQAKAAEIKQKQRTERVAIRWANTWRQYLHFARKLRSPAKSYDLWYLAVLLVGPFTIGAIAFVLIDSLLNSISIAVWSSAICTTAAIGALAILLHYPNSSQIPILILNAETDVASASERLSQLSGFNGLASVEAQLHNLFKVRDELQLKLRELLAGPEGRRTALLQQDWISMRGNEWEEFLVKVFSELEARAKRIGGAGDQGVDIIVEIASVRIAVQAKGYGGLVTNKAIQEVFAGMTHHRCDACIVITNSKFTASAIQIATSTNCILIGRPEFPEFVMGKLELERLVAAIVDSTPVVEVRTTY